MTEKQFITDLFWHDHTLPLDFMIKKCTKEKNSTALGLYMIADALSSGLLHMTDNGEVLLVRQNAA